MSRSRAGPGGRAGPAGTRGGAAAPAHHVVQFYGQDGDLARSAGGFLADAVISGGTAVVVATAAHREAIEAWLASAGVDVRLAGAAGAYLALDAATVLREFLRDGQPEAVAFHDTVGRLVRQAAGAGQPVHVYGEMVSLLWDAGQVNAALQLEGLWNGLATRIPFSLFCAYPASSVTSTAHREALSEVCHLHGAVVGPPGGLDGMTEASATFAGERESPRAARQFVTETLVQWGALDLIEDAAIVVTELATNAVVHAHSGFTVTVSTGEDSVRICVRDSVPLSASAGSSPLAAQPSHGLGVIAAVSHRWRAEDTGSGKAVWADLRR